MNTEGKRYSLQGMRMSMLQRLMKLGGHVKGALQIINLCLPLSQLQTAKQVRVKCLPP
jgi:hypothetical protein